MKNYLRSPYLMLLSLLVLMSCGSKGHEQVKALPNSVKTQQVGTTDSYQQFSYSGQLESSKKSMLSFLVPGMIETMRVNEGQKVVKGELLATISPVDYSNQLALQKARLLEAEDTYNRMTTLYKKNSIPESDFIKSKAAFMQVSALVSIAEKKLADTRIYAPYDGVILKKLTRRGTVVSPGISIYEIVDLNDLEIVVSVPQDEINQLAIGDKLEATIPSLKGKQVTGRVTSILPTADAFTRSFRVKAAILNGDGSLKDGMLTDVSIKTQERQKALTIPGHAVVMSSANIPYVYRYESTGNRVVQQRIELGSVLGANIQVLGGLSSQDIIVVEGQHRVKDGETVKVANNG